jgi:uncharacterized protein (TIGR03435 family)
MHLIEPRLQHIRILSLVAFASVIAVGQTNAPPSRAEFSVASVKPSAPGESAFVQVTPGMLRMKNCTPRCMLLIAYGIEGYQISGGPSWLATEHYNIEAKAEGNASAQQMQGPMLQALLAERFKLLIHREMKDGSAYELKQVDGNQKVPGSKATNCVPYSAETPPAAVPQPGGSRPNFCDHPHYSVAGPRRTLEGNGISIAELAKALQSAELRRPVIDRTGLTGIFDVHLEWTNDVTNAPETSDVPSVFTALREQLGLKLDSVRAPSEVIVVDRIEKPTEN